MSEHEGYWAQALSKEHIPVEVAFPVVRKVQEDRRVERPPCVIEGNGGAGDMEGFDVTRFDGIKSVESPAHF